MNRTTTLFTLEFERHLFLASTSPRRKELLDSIALPYQIIRPDNVEPDPLPGENPIVFVGRAAKAKGHAALKSIDVEKRKHFIILAADTIVCLDNEILGKPDNARHALYMLQKLSGRIHQVLSSVYLAWDSTSTLEEYTFTELTEVCFYSWPEEILRTYSQSQEPLDKAGAYAIQGLGAFLVKSIDGSWTNVVGLPLSTLIQKMLSFGLIIPHT